MIIIAIVIIVTMIALLLCAGSIYSVIKQKISKVSLSLSLSSLSLSDFFMKNTHAPLSLSTRLLSPQ